MDLSSSENWTLLFNETLTGSSLKNFLVPATFSSQVVAVFVSIPSPPSTWYTGGWLIQQPIVANLTNNSIAWIAYHQRLVLGGNIVVFPNPFDSYEIQINFPIWFSTAFISVWQFGGSSNGQLTPSGQISTIIQDLVDIAQNVTTLIQIINGLVTLIGG